MFSNRVFLSSFANFILNSRNCFWEVVHTSPRLTKRVLVRPGRKYTKEAVSIQQECVPVLQQFYCLV